MHKVHAFLSNELSNFPLPTHVCHVIKALVVYVANLWCNSSISTFERHWSFCCCWVCLLPLGFSDLFLPVLFLSKVCDPFKCFWQLHLLIWGQVSLALQLVHHLVWRRILTLALIFCLFLFHVMCKVVHKSNNHSSYVVNATMHMLISSTSVSSVKWATSPLPQVSSLQANLARFQYDIQARCSCFWQG